MATELAKAYVQIIPTAEGIQSKLQQELGGAADAAGEKAGHSLGSKLSGAMGTAAKAGLAAVTAATAAVAGFAKGAVNVGAEFDASMSQVAAVSGATGQEFDALREKAMEMGASTKFSASESAEAFNYMAMAGWKTEDMLDGIEGIMSLAAASGESLATTSDIVTDALTAFGLSAEDSSRFADVLAAASSNANTNVGMMGETFKYVAPLAGALNFSAEDTATAIGLMANAGIKGSQAGTALRSIMTRLASPTKDAETAMNVLGISLQDDEGKMYSLAEVMDQMRKGFANLQISEEEYNAGMESINWQLENGIIKQKEYDEAAARLDARAHGSTEALQAEYAAMLGGQEALSGLLAIVNAAPEDYEKLTSAIYDSDGAAAQMAATMQDNLAGDITIMKSALEGAKIAVSDQLTPAFREFVQFGTNGISELTTAFQEGGLSGAMEALGGILSDGLAMITEKLPEFVEAGMGLLSALGQGLLDNAPLLVQTALDICLMLGTYLVEAAPALVDAAVQLVDDLASWIGEYADVMAEAAVTIIITLFEALTNPDNIGTLVDAAIFLIVSLADAIISNLPALIEKAPVIVENLVRAIIENAPKLLEAALELIIMAAQGLIDNLPRILAAAGSIVEELVRGLIEFGAQLRQTGGDLIARLIDGIREAFQKLVNAGKEIVDTVKTGFQQKIQDAKNWGRDLIANFIAGIKEKWEALKSSVSNIASTVKSFLGHSHPTEGPMADDNTWMPDMMRSFAQGIRDNRGLVLGEMDKLADDMSGSLDWGSPAFAMAGGPAYNAGAGAGSAAASELRGIVDALRGMRVVLSTGETVGALTVPLNDSLGNQYSYSKRGI